MSNVETGWLIERQVGGRAAWWRGVRGAAVDWTTDSLEAVRFSRQVDAERVIAELGIPGQALEHMWIGPLVETGARFAVVSGSGAGWGRYHTRAEAIARRDSITEPDAHVFELADDHP